MTENMARKKLRKKSDCVGTRSEKDCDEKRKSNSCCQDTFNWNRPSQSSQFEKLSA